MPRVSVIIPTYERRGFLDEALASVVSQTFTDREVIVVEDGSRMVEETLGKYGDRVRRVWQTNQGAGTARNTGAGIAQGEWLAFLDDDIWLPTKGPGGSRGARTSACRRGLRDGHGGESCAA
jgi:glycosyltransferase involved in cell wall biosynthesis